jgi:hypothetical protein
LNLSEYAGSQKVGIFAEFSDTGDGKPTVMRYIIRGQSEMAENRQGELCGNGKRGSATVQKFFNLKQVK